MLEWVAVIGGGIVIALVVEAFLVQAFWIPSPRWSPRWRSATGCWSTSSRTGSTTCTGATSWCSSDRPRRPTASDSEIKDLIKRVVAVEGDTVETRDGALYVNRELIDEPYLEPGTRTDMSEAVTVPDGHVFVMGDNRHRTARTAASSGPSTRTRSWAAPS